MLIGISGRRGVGKTAAALHMVKKHKYVKHSFAQDLRDMAKTMFPFTENDFNLPSKKESPFKTYEWSPREFMVGLGDFLRYHDQDYWLKRALVRCVDPKASYVFDDVRFPNEADAIRAKGGKILRIERYEKQNPYGKNLDIASESSLDTYNFDYRIEPMWNLTLAELHRQVDAFLEM